MGDAAIQARLQTLLQALNDFDNADVTLGDFRVLGRGSAPYAIILPGAFSSRRSGDFSQTQIEWMHYIEIWDRFSGDDYADITALRQTVIDHLNTYPTLNALTGITYALAVASGELTYLWQKGQARTALPSFVGFRITVTCVEEVNYVGEGEYTT